MRLMLSLCIIILFCASASAQSNKQSNTETSAEAFYPQEEKIPKSSRNKSNKATYEARDKSYDRLERNWKTREKKEKKITRNPSKDYSIAPYFGHKRPPKIRPVGKRKVCKVCGVTH
jgi:hypothetical protein